jgi:hypothetical protein
MSATNIDPFMHEKKKRRRERKVSGEGRNSERHYILRGEAKIAGSEGSQAVSVLLKVCGEEGKELGSDKGKVLGSGIFF